MCKGEGEWEGVTHLGEVLKLLHHLVPVEDGGENGGGETEGGGGETHLGKVPELLHHLVPV